MSTPDSQLPPLTETTLWQILNEELDDATVNRLLWQCLGYRYDAQSQTWRSDRVPLEWQQEYPQPPDFIGSRPAIVKLTRSIPPAHKQLLKEQLGFAGYEIKELNPRRTRRATAVNWLLSYMATQEEAQAK
ncbi:DUF1823 family protein [Thermosynechococcus vestitus]|uniref:Tlr1934 protein n=1 Tax=Thermosynechococcus vestitus (strain NIES-2133 / IAM M-273 / BP-1) TaxID=197221 RepID=Q8DHL5_THEVB|nr:DUF1823 family protein [Thermosynechococcus vestitus]BAC09486.1 tlr1934 [Thermosynechococcus vestitus BP-1]